MTKFILLVLGGCFLVTGFGNVTWLDSSPKDTKEGPASRIAGGDIARKGEFPFMLRLAEAESCGAVLISPSCALTAAHCVHDQWYSTIIAGDWNADEWEDTEQVIEACVTLHPSYNRVTRENDIAILRTWRPFETGNNTFVLPIELPSEGSVPSTSFNATVMGWGSAAAAAGGGRQEEKILKKAVVPTWSDQDCQEHYGNDTIKDSMLCAGNNVVEIFKEDSGSPLIISGEAGSPVLVGLISWSIEGTDPKSLGVYTEVSFFMTWIQDLMNQDVFVCPRH